MANVLVLHNAEKDSFTISSVVYIGNGSATSMSNLNIFKGPNPISSVNGYVIGPEETVYIGSGNSIISSSIPATVPPDQYYLIALENSSTTISTIIYSNAVLSAPSNSNLFKF